MSSQFHDSVRDSGLSIPAWRILASLYGGVTRTLPDLEARTFLDTESLSDSLLSLQEVGLCSIDVQNDTKMVTEPPEGHKRIEHLFEQGVKLDQSAVGEGGDEALRELITLLATVVRNTNSLM